ncbi:hypothetical protein AKJ61_02505 [candidate division MSBL1 archaeon SCGC-AAA259B11]|uniref:Uncharacterized protein n=1 Tax=candidate division MSBL1 archaeon SCGC-AAA259B11 TaxID=1698260 RepID=A0A133U657_9EURY|nr:hypothetical protein AKJ61_02505 [candidate division MSBL1 archaeon SCGC-AAA259B11]
MKEEEMFDPIINHLEKNGYEIIEQNRGRERGPDLVASKDNQELIIEMKGDSEALGVDYGTCIGQLFRRMEDDDRDYGLALSASYRRFIKDSEYPLEKLGIKVFIVSKEGVEKWSGEVGFVVYVDDPLDYARVHKESCRFYQKREGEDMETGHWKGGFDTKEEALNYAHQTETSKVNTCSFCMK